MAFIYEVNGQRVEFEKEPTEKDIDEAARALAPPPESRQPKPVEGGGGAAFGVYRPQGRRPESQNQNRESNKEMAVQTGRGVISNVAMPLGLPVDIGNFVYGQAIKPAVDFVSSQAEQLRMPRYSDLPPLAQDIGNRYSSVKSQLAGNQRQPLPEVPKMEKIPGIGDYGMGFYNQFVPGPEPETPAQAMAFAGGQAVGAPLGPKTISAVAPTVKYGANLAKDVAGVVGSPVQSARTAFDAFGRGYKNPANVGGEGSALMPIREKFYPHEQVAEFQAGQRTPLQMSEVSTAPLTQNNVMNRFATNMAPTNKAGEALVAPKGRGLEGYFENLGSTYKQNPYLGVLDAITGVGGMALTGGYPTPITALTKSIPALAARQLQKATQFEPNFSADAIKAVQARSMFEPLQNPIPMQQPLALPAPTGSVSPTRTMYVNPEGVATTNVQGTQTNYKPGGRVTPNFATIRTQNQQAANQSRQAAAQKLQDIEYQQNQLANKEASQQLKADTKGNEIVAQIRERNKQREAGVFTSTPPTKGPFAQVETPVTGPVSPASIDASIDALPSDRFSFADKLALKRAELQKTPPTVMTAAQEAKARADMAKQSNLTDWGKKTTADKDMARGILSQYFDEGGKGTSIFKDMIDLDDKTAIKEMGGSKLVKAAKIIQQKAAVDGIPTIPGFRDTEVIRMAADMLKDTPKKTTPYIPTETKSTASSKELLSKINKQNNPPPGVIYDEKLKAFREEGLRESQEAARPSISNKNTPPKNVSQMMVGDPKPTGALEKSLVTKRSFNGDLQKYRYGTEKSPLSLEEYNHLKNSEFIDKQNTRDIIMGMRPDLTEYSIWYKDKSGKIQNIQTYGNEFKKK
jgi:hypothetical protein